MNTTSLPLVTIGTLCYNTGKYVIEALDCVKRQGYPNIQHIIIDDCSQDNSVALIEDWIKRNNYACTFIKRPVNKGVHAGLTEIIGSAQGKYFAMISDDLWTDDKLIKQIKVFETLDNSYAMVYGDTQMIDKDGKVLIPSMFKHYRGENFIPPSGNIFHEVAHDFYFFIQAATISLKHFKSINYSFSKDIVSEDWDWQLALARLYKICSINQIFAKYRYVGTSITRTNWTDEKRHKVWLSHAKMLLAYYNKPGTNKEDKNVIFNRVWRVYEELIQMKNFKKKDKIKLLTYILRVTWKWKLIPVIVVVLLFSREAMIKRIIGLSVNPLK
jgi:glycosyltransferase involved in cell wall biosynthesis